MLSEYFMGVLGALTFISLLLGVVHPSVKKATSFAAGSLVICTVMLPLVDFIRGFNFDITEDSLLGDLDYSATDSAVELAFEDGIARYVAEKYGVKRECVSVRADGFDIGALRAERIYVTLRGGGLLLDRGEIEKEISYQFTYSGECEVFYDIG